MITLLNGDCLEEMKKVPDKSVDLIICDLPYGCLSNTAVNPTEYQKETEKQYGKGRLKSTRIDTNCAWDVKINLEPFWEQVRRIRRNDNVPCIHFCTTKFGFDLYASNPSEFRYDLVWNKQRGVSFLAANKMPMRSHEMIYVFSKKGASYNRIDITGDFKPYSRSGKGISRQYGIERIDDGKCCGDGKRCVLSVINNPTSATRGGHPTEKPIDIYKFLIERYCPKDGTVMDPTFGSGNSGRACLSLGLNYVGIEKDKGFFDKAKADLLPSEVPTISHV
jgi:hypothetical protein